MIGNRLSGRSLPVSRDTWLPLCFLVVLLLIPVFFFDPGATSRTRLVSLVLVFALFTMGLNLVFGHTNQLFLFVGALAGVGAYTMSILAMEYAISPWMTLPLGALLAGGIGFLVSYVAAKRRFTVIVLAILTLALQLAFIELFIGAREITRGTTGYPFAGLEIEFLADAFGWDRFIAVYHLLAVSLVLALLLYGRLRRSKFGLAMATIRDDEIASETIGINVVRYKSLVGFTGAALIGYTGAFYIQLEGWVLPDMFTFVRVDILVLIMLVLGGMRTMWGPVVGAAVVIGLEEIVVELGQWRLSVLGLLLVILFLYFRRGIVPYVAEAPSRWGPTVREWVARVRGSGEKS